MSEIISLVEFSSLWRGEKRERMKVVERFSPIKMMLDAVFHVTTNKKVLAKSLLKALLTK